ncbi:MG2 domain-containing protein [uncultured Roseivirga sp.]|uniref:alpha-2-macroglobulin family protein n=1 Tax=uncultured Roseivirga sp. TaxID=543088 RepID=UPI0025881321|nr:MG2 domain-containing protein [uncultured Roseivirga sp.]
MSRTLQLFMLIILLLSLDLKAQDFDYLAAWNDVKRLELQGLSESALQKIDSIYSKASVDENDQEKLKATIYQTKYALLLKEDAQNEVLKVLTHRATSAKEPYRSVYHYLRASSLFSYYSSNSYRIDQRQVENTDTTDFSFWSKAKFQEEIHASFSKSLRTDENPLLYNKSIQMLFKTDSLNKYQGLTLKDWIAKKAIEFYFFQPFQNPIKWQNEEDVWRWESFSRINFSAEASYSRNHGLMLLQEMGEEARKSGSKERITFWELYRLRTLSQLNVANNQEQLIEAYRELLSHEEILQPTLKIALALKLNDLSNDYSYSRLKHFDSAKVEAHRLATEIIAEEEESHEFEQAKALLSLLEQPKISGRIQGYILPETYSRTFISYANIEELEIKLFKPSTNKWLKLKNIFAKPEMSEMLAEINPFKSWNQRLPQKEDFNTHSTELLIEPLPKGQYTMAFYSSDSSSELLGFTHFQVSDIVLANLGSDELNEFAVAKRDNGQPLAGARIQFLSSNRANKNPSVFSHTFTSDSNGRFYVKNKVYEYGISALIWHNSDTTHFNNISLSTYKKYSNDDPNYYTVRTNVFSDRAIYRPGQTVYFKGIVSKSKGSEQGVVANEEVLVTIYDNDLNTIYKENLNTNEFGSFSDSLKLPKNILTGQFRIRVEEGYAPSTFYEEQTDEFFSVPATFKVENYKRPRFELEFDRVDSAYTLGDSVIISGSVNALAGNSLSNAQIRYTVTQRGYRTKPNIEEPYYWQSSWVEDEEVLVSLEDRIGQDGTFEIMFPTYKKETLTPEQLPVYAYQVEVSVTDINGETREISQEIEVGLHKAKSSISVKSNVLKQEKALTVNVSATNLNGGVYQESGTLQVYRLDSKEYLFERLWDAPDLPILNEEEFRKHFPNEPFSEEATKPSEILVYETEVGKTQTKAIVPIIAQWEAGDYLLRFKSDRELAEPVTTNFTLKESTDQVLDSQFISVLADKPEYKVGETVRLTVSSGLKDLTILLQPKKLNGEKREYILRLNQRTQTIKLPIEKDDLGGFEVHYLAIGSNHSETGSLEIKVPQPKAVLEIEAKTFRSLLEPGSEETWSFKITGTKGRAEEAEVLASMYDASLDQFASNDWRFNPSSQKLYNTYSDYSTFPSFNTSSIRSVIPYFRRDFKQKTLPDFQSFGYSFVNVRNAHSEYLAFLLANVSASIKVRKLEGIPAGEIEGVVRDEIGQPLPGAYLRISDTNQTSLSNEEGKFSLRASNNNEIIVSFLGYKTLKFNVDENNFYEIDMSPDFQELGEIVVVGYGEMLKKDLSFSLPDEEDAFEMVPEDVLQGSVSGLNVTSEGLKVSLRGIGSNDKEQTSLYVIDGKVSEINELSQDDIESMTILKGEAATALYGSRAANGVIIISTKGAVAQEKKLLANVRARTDFRETAFFFPHLRTDKNGNTNFSFSTPESLTRWKFQMLAHTKKLAHKQLVSTVQTKKTLMVSPNLPRFVRAGDTLVVSSKVINTSDKPVQTSTQLSLTNPENEEELNLLVLGSKTIQRQLIGAKNSVEVFWHVVIPENLNALQYKVVATGAGFSDGEENYLPVLPKKILITESLPIWVSADTVQSFQLPSLLNKKEEVTDVSLKLELTKNPIWNAVQSLPYLIEFPYECSEQTFARIFANALGSKLLKDNLGLADQVDGWAKSEVSETPLFRNEGYKQITLQETPWVNNARTEEERKKRMAELLDSDNLNTHLASAVDKLKQLQLTNGGFGWFSGSQTANHTITLHIVSGFGQMKNLGVSLDSLEVNDLLFKAIHYLDREALNSFKTYRNLESASRLNTATINYLYARSFFVDNEISDELEEVIAFFLSQSEKEWVTQSLQLKAMLALALDRFGKNESAERIINSLKETSTFSEEKGMYWLENESDYGWYKAPIETQALIIEAFETIQPGSEQTQELQKWLLQNKRVNSWSTTKATTLAIYALLQNQKTSLTSIENTSVSMSGEPITFNESESNLFLEKTWTGTQIKAEMGTVTIDNSAKNPAWGALHYQSLLEVNQVEKQGGALKIERELYLIQQNGEQSKISESTALSLGDKVRVQLYLSIDREMEFIHLKDSRPAALEPVDVLSGYKNIGETWAYQSVSDASMHFFIDKLPKGKHSFSYDLVVNNAGAFSQGLATIENMYAPEFNARTKSSKLKVIK